MTVCHSCKEQKKQKCGPKGSYVLVCKITKRSCIKSRTADNQCGQVQPVRSGGPK